MHELSIASNIIEIVKQNLTSDNEQRVESIKLRIGEFAGIVPESLEFCFAALTQGTALGNAILAIDRVQLTALCQDCGISSSIKVGSFICPSCQSQSLTITSGKELEVVEILLHNGAENIQS